MKRILTIFSVILITISCKKDDQIPTQLLINPDIESNNLSSWFNWGTGGVYNAAITDEESFTPSHSLKIANGTIDNINFWYWYQKYEGAMPYGEELTLSAKIKGKNLVGKGISVALRGDDIQDSVSQFITTYGYIEIIGTFDWTQYNFTLPKLNSDVTKLWVFLLCNNSTTGTVFFDDITLTHNK
jgi:hypothetical protein